MIDEIRLMICGWCFHLVLFLAPKDNPEGLMIIEFIKDWASKSIAYSIMIEKIKMKGGE